MTRLVDPRFMELNAWADSTVYDLEGFGPIQQLQDPSEWQNWAAGLITINGISQQNPPSPYGYTDWREWAMRFYEMLD